MSTTSRAKGFAPTWRLVLSIALLAVLALLLFGWFGVQEAAAQTPINTAVTILDVAEISTCSGTPDCPDPSVVGQVFAVEFEVRVTGDNPNSYSPYGTLTVDDGHGATCQRTVTSGSYPYGWASDCSLTSYTAGNLTLTATFVPLYPDEFNGDSDTEPHQVLKSNTTTALTSSPNPSAEGQAVTLSATVAAVSPGGGTPAGTVSFYADGVLLGTATLNSSGVATFSTSTFALGTYLLTAEYTGNANYNGSESGEVTHSVLDADLKIIKMVKPDGEVRASETVVYTILVDNLGPAAASNLVVSDSMTASGSYTVQSIAPDHGGSCTPAAPASSSGTNNQVAIRCTLAELEAHGRWTIVVSAVANQTIDINNVASVYAEVPSDPNLEDNYVDGAIAVTDVADLEIAKTADTPSVVAGEDASWTVTVTNDGPSPAENVQVIDVLPAGLVDGSLTVSAAGCTLGTPGDPTDPLVCNLGTLGVEDDVSFTVTGSVDPAFLLNQPDSAVADHLDNDAWVMSDTFDPDNSNNRDSDFVGVEARADLSLLKFAVGTPTAGTEIHYEYEIANAGPSWSGDVTLRDLLPSQVEFLSAYVDWEGGTGGVPLPCDVVAGSNALFCPLGDIPLTGSTPIMVLVNVRINPDAAGSLTNSADLNLRDTPDPNTANNSATVTSELRYEANLSIEKTSDPLKVYPGEQITYEIVVTNDGPSTADPVLVRDDLPPQVDYEIDTAGCTLASEDPDTLNCDLGVLAPGESRSFQISALVPPDAPPGTIVNTASANEVFVATAETLVLDPIAADLQLDKNAVPLDPDAGQTVQFQLLVTNNGPVAAENVVLEDMLPEGVTVVEVHPGPDSCTTGTPGSEPLRCNLGTLASTASQFVEVIVRIDPDYMGRLENDAVVSSDIPDPNNSNNRDFVILDIGTSSDVFMKKGCGWDWDVLAGEPIQYDILVRNNGPSTLHNYEIWDLLSDDVTFLSYEILPGGGECFYTPQLPPMHGGPGQGLHCYLGDIAPNDTRILYVRVRVNPDAPEGELTNEITDYAADSNFGLTLQSDLSCENNVINNADLSIRKTADPYKVYAGEQVRYDIAVTNQGPSVAHNVLVTDTLPSGVEFEISTVDCRQVVVPKLLLGSSGYSFGYIPGELFSVDHTSAASTLIGQMLGGPLATEIEYDPSTGSLYASEVSMGNPLLHTIDPATGATLGTVVVGPYPGDPIVAGMEFVGPTLYATVHDWMWSSNSALYVLNSSTGFLSPVGPPTPYLMITGLAYDDATGTMYGVGSASPFAPQDLLTIDLSTGVATPVGPLMVGATPLVKVGSIEFGPDGNLYGGLASQDPIWPNHLVRINTSTGAATVIGNTGYPITGLTLMSGPTGELVCDLGEIPPGETSTFSIWARVKPNTLDTITNRVDVYTDTADPNPDNDWDTEANLVLGKADLKVTKYGKPDGEVRAGEELEYWVIVDNLGPGYAHDVVLYDQISSDGDFELSLDEPFGYSCQVDGCDCYYDECDCDGDARLTCRLNDPLPVMTPSSSGRWLLKVWVVADEDQSINNLARVVSSDFDPDLSNNEAFAEHDITAVADLWLGKEARGEVLVGCDAETDLWEDEVAAGGMLTYTLWVDNRGPSTAENVVVEDWGLSPFLDIIGVECEKNGEDPGDGCSCNISELGELGDENRRLVCYLGTIEWGDEDQIRISARIPSDVPEGTRLVNDAKVYSDVFDDDNGDNLAYNWTYVTVRADLGVAKSQEPETTLPGLEVVYTVRVDNLGPSDAHGVLISDTLPFTPTMMTVEGCASDGGQCDVPCDVPTCPAGECPWPDVDFVAQADIPAGEWVIYTLTAIPEWVPCEMITNTVQVVAEYDYEHDIDPCDENDFGYTESDPECNFVPLVLKEYPGPDSPL